MYDVLDVCRFLINFCNENDFSVSNLKLQKLLYFIQVYFLMQTDGKEYCFKENIEAWNFGPVVPEAYHEFKQYGNTDIPAVKTYYEFKGKILIKKRYCADIIQEEHRAMITEVVNKLDRYSATALVQITHNQAPWKDAYVPYENNIITIDALRKYFL